MIHKQIDKFDNELIQRREFNRIACDYMTDLVSLKNNATNLISNDTIQDFELKKIEEYTKYIFENIKELIEEKKIEMINETIRGAEDK